MICRICIHCLSYTLPKKSPGMLDCLLFTEMERQIRWGIRWTILVTTAKILKSRTLFLTYLACITMLNGLKTCTPKEQGYNAPPDLPFHLTILRTLCLAIHYLTVRPANFGRKMNHHRPWIVNQPIISRQPFQQKNLCGDECTFWGVYQIFL